MLGGIPYNKNGDRGTEYMARYVTENIFPITKNIKDLNWILLPGENDISLAYKNKNIVWCHLPSYDMDLVNGIYFIDMNIVNNTVAYIVQTEWHKKDIIDTFNIDPDKVFILNNAFKSVEVLEKDKNHISFIYTSQMSRGISLLSEAFSKIKDDNISLTIHSCPCDNCKSYIKDNTDERIKFVGFTSKEEYFYNLGRAHIYAYPCTFEETACIGIMEALSAGVRVICTDIGALPETSLGYAKIIKGMPQSGTISGKNKEKLIKDFVREMKKSIKDARKNKFNYSMQKRDIDYRFSWENAKNQWIDFDNKIGHILSNA